MGKNDSKNAFEPQIHVLNAKKHQNFCQTGNALRIFQLFTRAAFCVGSAGASPEPDTNKKIIDFDEILHRF
jgi:hypothetical protein